MQFKTRRWMTGAALSTMVAVGCGDLSDEGSKPPVLASLRGSLSLGNGMAPPTGPVRVALVWNDPQSDDTEERDACFALTENIKHMSAQPGSELEDRLLLKSMQQAVEVKPQFPSAFTLEITEPPPKEALYAKASGAQFAEGRIVVYRDGNGNGRLDPRTLTTFAPDELLDVGAYGFALQSESQATTKQIWEYAIWYSDRASKAGPDTAIDLAAGYNIIGYQNYGELGVRVQSEIDLQIMPTIALQEQLCPDSCVIVDSTPFACPDNPRADLPAIPADAKLGWQGSNRAAIWQTGPDSFVNDQRACTTAAGDYQFLWTQYIVSGCQSRRIIQCPYGPAAQPNPNWPCDTSEML